MGKYRTIMILLHKFKVDYCFTTMPVLSQGHYGFHSFPVVD